MVIYADLWQRQIIYDVVAWRWFELAGNVSDLKVNEVQHIWNTMQQITYANLW